MVVYQVCSMSEMPSSKAFPTAVDSGDSKGEIRLYHKRTFHSAKKAGGIPLLTSGVGVKILVNYIFLLLRPWSGSGYGFAAGQGFQKFLNVQGQKSADALRELLSRAGPFAFELERLFFCLFLCSSQ